MNQVISKSNLVLIFSFIKIFIQHLNESLLTIEFPLVILRMNIDFIFQLFGFRNSHNFSPISQQFFLVKTNKFLFFLNFLSQIIPFFFSHFFKLIELNLVLIDLSELYIPLYRNTARPCGFAL